MWNSVFNRSYIDEFCQGDFQGLEKCEGWKYIRKLEFVKDGDGGGGNDSSSSNSNSSNSSIVQLY